MAPRELSPVLVFAPNSPFSATPLVVGFHKNTKLPQLLRFGDGETEYRAMAGREERLQGKP